MMVTHSIAIQDHYASDLLGDAATSTFPLAPDAVHASEAIGRAALRALYLELSAYPKPGLVSFIDSGSHRDMDASTFVRSIRSLRDYFRDTALAGMHGARFEELRRLGLAAESRMLKATGNINTHRGAIFSMGLLSAAAGILKSECRRISGESLGRTVRERWGKDILSDIPSEPCSHGTLVAFRYGVPGARQEAAAGFPRVFNTALPALRESLSGGIDFNAAVIQTFFTLMAIVPDSNVLFRGGQEGLGYARRAAQTFLAGGGVYRRTWQVDACGVHRDMTCRGLSPGGSADLLALTLFAHEIIGGDSACFL